MSARDAPEWFGGESKTSHGGKSTNHTGRSSSSYNNQRRNPQPRRLSGGGGGGGGSGTTTPGKESDRRKKSSSHRRTKSREVINVPEVFDNKQQDTNFLTRIAPVENKTTNNPSKMKTRGEQKGRASVSKVTSEQGHDFRDGREKKTSLFEKLLGLTPARAYSRIKDDDRTKSQKRLLSKDNAVYDIVRSKSTGSADSDPTDSRNYRDTPTTSNPHRRSYSDSIDISQLYASGEVLPPFSDVGPQGMKEHMYYSSHQPHISTTQPEYYNNGAESDDPLVYSEDESTAAYSRNNGASQLRPLNHRLPYQHSRFNHSQETQQMQEHQRMMALAPNRQVASYVRQMPSTRSSYGSIYVPSNFQRPSSTSPVNEFYMSEDETLMSDTSMSRNSWQRSIRDYRSDVDKIIPEEEEGASESTTLLSPKSSNPVLSSALSVRSNSSHSNSGNRSVPNIPTPSLSNTSGNSSSGSFDVDLIQIRKRVSPPPPLQSVSVDYPNHHRSVSAGTATTVSTSLHSPQKGLLRQNLQTGPPRIFSRKEQKRLMRKLESLEKKEYQIQSIIRSGDGTALDWSGHVPQEIRGLNLAAGFFPHEESKAQDVLFAILFLLQMCFVIVLAIVYIGDTVLTGDNATVASPHPSQSFTDDPFSTGSAFVIQNGFGAGKSVASNRSIQVDYSNAFQLSCISALYSASLSALLIGMMMILGKALIPTTLCLTVITCIAFSTIGIALSPYSFVPIIGIIALALSVGYSIVVWDRIPFAATNLDTALCGVKCTADVLVVGMVMMSAAYLWTITWTVAFLGVYDHYLDDWTDQDSDDFIDWIGILIYGGMFTSYFWTLSVFMNVIHVTVAGVVAQWWSDPGSMTTCCNHVLRENFALSLTSSFGSICLGSFMSPLLRFMKGTFSICCNSYSSNNHSPLTASSSHESVVSNNFSEKGVQFDPSAVAKLPVMTSPFDGMIKYYNDFGFTFVGIYREKFTESSRKATEIFETREWVGVVSDQLIDNVLGLIITAITLGTGCLGLVVEEFDGYSFTNFHKPALTAFMIGCYIGLVVSSVCLKVVTSSVNTVLVCFAVAPWKFQANHPGLSKEMRESWGGIWLDEYEWLSTAEAGLQREDMKI